MGEGSHVGCIVAQVTARVSDQGKRVCASGCGVGGRDREPLHVCPQRPWQPVSPDLMRKTKDPTEECCNQHYPYRSPISMLASTGVGNVQEQTTLVQMW